MIYYTVRATLPQVFRNPREVCLVQLRAAITSADSLSPNGPYAAGFRVGDPERTALAGAKFGAYAASFWGRAVLCFATCISSSASQYFFLCGELQNERQMAFRSRWISAFSIPRLWRALLPYR